MQPHLDDKSNPAASRIGLEVHDSFVRFLFRNRPSGGTGLSQLDFYWFSIRFLGLDFHRFFWAAAVAADGVVVAAVAGVCSLLVFPRFL